MKEISVRRRIIGITVIVIGCCFVLYPIIGNIINAVRQNSVQTEYNSKVLTLDDISKETIKSNADDYNKRLASGDLDLISTDEDSIGEDYDDGSGYKDALDVGSDAIAFISIPKIDVKLPIYRGTNTATLEKGVGHLRNTSLPVGGESTHCVLTGHTGLPSSVLFSDISKLVEGDLFYIQYLDEIHAYQVDMTKVIEPDDSSDLGITEGKDYVTLLTCYPYGINSHRLIVRGERVPYDGRLDFDDSGKVTSVSESKVKESNDEPVAISEKSDIFDDFMNNSVKVSVYGMNVPLTPAIIAVSAAAALLAALVLATIVKLIKKPLIKSRPSD